MLLKPSSYITQSKLNMNRVSKADTVPIQDFTVCVVDRIIRRPNPDKEGFGDLTETRRFLFRTKAGQDFKADISKWDSKTAVLEYKAKLAAKKYIDNKVAKYANLFGYSR